VKFYYYAALILTASPFFAPVSTAAEGEAATFRKCMLMNADDAFRNSGCRSVLGKLHVTKSDLNKMKSCESHTSGAADNSDCIEMAKKHPDLVQGHGVMEDEGTK
jgi:hypothetical protein